MMHGGTKEGSNSASGGEEDDRILQFKQALRALVKTMKPDKLDASKVQASVDESKKTATAIENHERDLMQGDLPKDESDGIIVSQLQQLDSKLEAYLGSEVLESDKEMDGASEILTEILNQLREALTWAISTRLLQSKNQLVKNLRLASKLRADEGSPYSKYVEDIAMASSAVVAEWKRLLAQE